MQSWEWKGVLVGWVLLSSHHGAAPKGSREAGTVGLGVRILLGTHHGAGSPHQQGHGVSVLLQQGDGRVSDLPVLALEDDEDGFPGKLQQPPEPFPARQVGDRRVRDPRAPLHSCGGYSAPT